MKLVRFFSSPRPMAAAAVLLLIVAMTPAHAEDHLKVTLSANDRSAAESAKTAHMHAKPANTPAAMNAQNRQVFSSTRRAAVKSEEVNDSAVQTRYPGDLSYQGGEVVKAAESHAVFLNPGGGCSTLSCWGDPEGFLNDLAKSDFIHVTDRFVGTKDNNRYTLGQGVELLYTPPAAPLTDQDMQAVAHAAAFATGLNGYGHIFHIFLPPGQDVCFDSSFSTCYSPDSPFSFFFCAYHSSVDFSDTTGHVLYTVEPFQDVRGCAVKPGTPNGQVADSTNNVLSHELFETITDPDGYGWWNTASVALHFAEDGDECAFITNIDGSIYFDPATFKIGSKPYAVQPEYSNLHHACTTAP